MRLLSEIVASSCAAGLAADQHRQRHALNPVSAFGTVGTEGPHMIGREDTGTLSTNHMRAFRPYSPESGDKV